MNGTQSIEFWLIDYSHSLQANLTMTDELFSLKKQPLQARALFTVSQIKQAAAQVLRDQGRAGFNTNRVAEIAGVSIGTLYQYFPSKDVLLAELKRDHFEQLRGMTRQAYLDNLNQPFPILVKEFIRASIRAHKFDPQLHQILVNEFDDFKLVEDDESENSVRSSIEVLLVQQAPRLRAGLDLPLAAKVCYQLVKTLTHQATGDNYLQDEDKLVDELSRIIFAYLGFVDDHHTRFVGTPKDGVVN